MGFGHVGRALLSQLISKETELRRLYDVRWRLTGIASRLIGWIAEPDGLNPIAVLNNRLLAQVQTARTVREWLERAKADVLFEASSLPAPRIGNELRTETQCVSDGLPEDGALEVHCFIHAWPDYRSPGPESLVGWTISLNITASWAEQRYS